MKTIIICAVAALTINVVAHAQKISSVEVKQVGQRLGAWSWSDLEVTAVASEPGLVKVECRLGGKNQDYAPLTMPAVGPYKVNFRIPSHDAEWLIIFRKEGGQIIAYKAQGAKAEAEFQKLIQEERKLLP